MRNNKVPIIVVSVMIVSAMIAGGFLLFTNRDGSIEPVDPSVTDTATDDNFGVTLDPSTGKDVIEFDEGNEIFLDTTLIAYLERMEQGIPATDENGNYYLYQNGELVLIDVTESVVKRKMS